MERTDLPELPEDAWAREVVDRAIAALGDRRDPEHAAGAEAYMHYVAPFLGIKAPDRRFYLETEWRDLATPTSDELGRAALALMALPEREYHYAAYDLVGTYLDVADASFLETYVAELITTKPWWDTCDAFVNAAVSPLCRRFDQAAVIDAWSESGDIWLIRAAIGHQRGWHDDTDSDRVLALCDRHWNNEEFFVAKAIGWALRDTAKVHPDAVTVFLGTHKGNPVATREARRGLEFA